MPIIRAFRGIRYNPDKIRGADVLCPPYDVIGLPQIDEYYDKTPYNAVRLELGRQFPKDTRENSRYTRTRTCFNEWLAEGVLIRDEGPSLYYHENTYGLGDKIHTRSGIIAAVRIDEGDERLILPHEDTTKAPKLDRLRLLAEVKANTSSVFGLYSDATRFVETQVRPALGDPVMKVEHGKVGHRLWVISDGALIEKITNLMGDKKLLIADGHHRYETAKIYRDRCRASSGKMNEDQACDYTMMYLSNMDAGLSILPTHRVIVDSMGIGLVDLEYRIKDLFNMVPYDNRKSFLNALRKGGSGHIGLYVSGIQRYYLLEPYKEADLDKFMDRDAHPYLKALDVTMLHSCILEPILGIDTSVASARITYLSDAEGALAMGESEKADIVFLLNPSSLEEIMRIAEAGLRMPQKATYFYPKVPAGLVFRPLG